MFETGVTVLTELFVFPIPFTAGISPADPRPEAILVALADAFAGTPYGSVAGVVCFGVFAVLTLYSAIRLLKVVVSYATEVYSAVRRRTTLLVWTIMFSLGAPAALVSSEHQPILVDLSDLLAAQHLLIAGGFSLVILIGWIGARRAMTAVRRGSDRIDPLPTLWIWLVRIPVIVVLLVTLYLALGDYWAFVTGHFADFLRV